jgi:hypothetical protein
MKGICFICDEEKEIVSNRSFKGETGPKPLCEDCEYEYEEQLLSL